MKLLNIMLILPIECLNEIMEALSYNIALRGLGVSYAPILMKKMSLQLSKDKQLKTVHIYVSESEAALIEESLDIQLKAVSNPQTNKKIDIAKLVLIVETHKLLTDTVMEIRKEVSDNQEVDVISGNSEIKVENETEKVVELKAPKLAENEHPKKDLDLLQKNQ